MDRKLLFCVFVLAVFSTKVLGLPVAQAPVGDVVEYEDGSVEETETQPVVLTKKGAVSKQYGHGSTTHGETQQSNGEGGHHALHTLGGLHQATRGGEHHGHGGGKTTGFGNGGLHQTMGGLHQASTGGLSQITGGLHQIGGGDHHGHSGGKTISFGNGGLTVTLRPVVRTTAAPEHHHAQILTTTPDPKLAFDVQMLTTTPDPNVDHGAAHAESGARIVRNGGSGPTEHLNDVISFSPKTNPPGDHHHAGAPPGQEKPHPVISTISPHGTPLIGQNPNPAPQIQPAPNGPPPNPQNPNPNPQNPNPNPFQPPPNPNPYDSNPNPPTPQNPNPFQPLPNPQNPNPNPFQSPPNPQNPNPNPFQPPPNSQNPNPNPFQPPPNPQNPNPNPFQPSPNPQNPNPYQPQPNPNPYQPQPNPNPYQPQPNPQNPYPNPQNPYPNPQNPYPNPQNPNPHAPSPVDIASILGAVGNATTNGEADKEEEDDDGGFQAIIDYVKELIKKYGVVPVLGAAVAMLLAFVFFGSKINAVILNPKSPVHKKLKTIANKGAKQKGPKGKVMKMLKKHLEKPRKPKEAKKKEDEDEEDPKKSTNQDQESKKRGDDVRKNKVSIEDDRGSQDSVEEKRQRRLDRERARGRGRDSEDRRKKRSVSEDSRVERRGDTDDRRKPKRGDPDDPRNRRSVSEDSRVMKRQDEDRRKPNRRSSRMDSDDSRNVRRGDEDDRRKKRRDRRNRGSSEDSSGIPVVATVHRDGRDAQKKARKPISPLPDVMYAQPGDRRASRAYDEPKTYPDDPGRKYSTDPHGYPTDPRGYPTDPRGYSNDPRGAVSPRDYARGGTLQIPRQYEDQPIRRAVSPRSAAQLQDPYMRSGTPSKNVAPNYEMSPMGRGPGSITSEIPPVSNGPASDQSRDDPRRPRNSNVAPLQNGYADSRPSSGAVSNSRGGPPPIVAPTPLRPSPVPGIGFPAPGIESNRTPIPFDNSAPTAFAKYNQNPADNYYDDTPAPQQYSERAPISNGPGPQYDQDYGHPPNEYRDYRPQY